MTTTLLSIEYIGCKCCNAYGTIGQFSQALRVKMLYCAFEGWMVPNDVAYLPGQFASNLQSLVRITDCALTVYCFWG